MNDQQFLRLAGIAALFTAFSTLAVHFIDFEADTFEQRVLLARDPLYLFQKRLIILHCLMVIVSMFGVAQVLRSQSRGVASLGALFFAVFGVAEMTRMFSIFSYINPLKEKYLAAASDPALQAVLQHDLENYSLLAGTLFLLFILAFALGNLFFGLGLMKSKGLDGWIGRGFLLWSALTFLAFCNDFWQTGFPEAVIDANNKFFQPLFRGLIGWWLLKKSSMAT